MRVAGREYRDLPVLQLAAHAPTLRSDVLGLELRLDRGALRFRDPATGEDLLGHDGERHARQAAEVRAEQADAAREAAEVQLAELRARLRDLQQGRASPEG